MSLIKYLGFWWQIKVIAFGSRNALPQLARNLIRDRDEPGL
jgi:hypothetical protein